MAWIGLVTGVVSSFLFCYLYARGNWPRGLAAGLAYGALIGALVGVSFAYEGFMLHPFSLTLAHAFFLASIAVTAVCGLILAKIAAAEDGRLPTLPT